MNAYLARRIAAIVPTLLFVSMLIFGLQQLLPGDPAMILAGEERDPAVIAHLRETMHLDEPLPLRYVYWLRGVLHGDLGESLRLQQPVRALIAAKLPVTTSSAGLRPCWPNPSASLTPSVASAGTSLSWSRPVPPGSPSPAG